tara:strand:+ start:941 stop:1141 length:201 start_codon:yes stop_codon:yes gene_type:complete
MKPIDHARDVIKNGYKKIDGMILDTFTASAVVQVYDQISESRADVLPKLDKLNLKQLVNFTWRITK